MSYEEDFRNRYRSKCACGQGFLQYYKISSSNDWGQTKEYSTPVEIFCDNCNNKYYYTHIHGNDYLVPKELTFPKQPQYIDKKYHYNDEEELVQKYKKIDIQAIIADMTAPKHTYIKNLTTQAAFTFANMWYGKYGKKSLKPMIEYLQGILCNYDSLIVSYENKKPIWDKYKNECETFSQLTQQVIEQSVMLEFQYNNEQEELERKRYEEEHKYDSFTAQVHYDPSIKKDFVNQYWDSYFIKECTDPQYLTLCKPRFGTPYITIAKKYLCICQICGKEIELVSSDMKISYNDEFGYYPVACCSCHVISSFEAKTMDILNRLGITYIREKSFEDLIGDSGKALRFDFALSKSYDNVGMPIIDLIIELQGPHHYKTGYYDDCGNYITDDIDYQQKSNEEKFNRQLKYDEMKKNYCSVHGINLECIKYSVSSNYERLEKMIIEILQKYGYRYLY